MYEVNNCNFVLNGQEYYSESVNSISNSSSLPVIGSGIFVTLLFVVFTGYFTYSTYKVAKQFTAATIFLLVLCLCCLSSFIGSIVNYTTTLSNVNKSNSPSKSVLKRPCFSVQKQVLITEGSNIPPDASPIPSYRDNSN
jgi:hypothetical protein